MTTKEKSRLLRRLAQVLILAGVFGVLCSGAIWYHYFETLPRSPDQKMGRIYSRNMNGIGVYQTKSERLRLNLLSGTSYAIGVIGILLGIAEEKSWQRSTGKYIPPMPHGWQPK